MSFENLCGLNLQKLRSKKCQKITKIELLFSFPEKKILVETQPHVQKCFNDHQFYTADVTPLGTPCLKISSQMDKNCRVQGVKSAEKWSNIDYNWHKNDLSYEFDFFVCMVGHLQKQQIDPRILSGCDEASLGMLKVLSNELAISQE